MPFIENTKIYEMNNLERNIIVGSLLGDGSLALYGRSKNAYYREHSCNKQAPYRQWKADKLKKLNFKINYESSAISLRSPSNIIYTDLYNKFYKENIKVITKDNIKLLNHPIGLACLYMDDGTLVIDTAKRTNGNIYIFPRIAIYSLCFTKEENQLLIKHISHTFNIEFKLKYRKDGKNYVLELNKRNHVIKFLDLIKPYINEIPCMKYKLDIEKRLEEKFIELSSTYPQKQIIISSLQIIDDKYSKEDEELIIKLRSSNTTYREISEILGRSYYGVVDKVRRMRNN